MPREPVKRSSGPDSSKIRNTQLLSSSRVEQPLRKWQALPPNFRLEGPQWKGFLTMKPTEEVLLCCREVAHVNLAAQATDHAEELGSRTGGEEEQALPRPNRFDHPSDLLPSSSSPRPPPSGTETLKSLSSSKSTNTVRFSTAEDNGATNRSIFHGIDFMDAHPLRVSMVSARARNLR
ncbi:hypothetical protein CVT26_014059 [Gymnopilus dilepis]|uniref:Uncharacterized protein n=1 Tax=Gymnopilus dilepis TaxID=231916 RepID=A0A409VX26_9AGAR|nr:hypothetical protein CVT26_014059 [Gymnopilus dilepis]